MITFETVGKVLCRRESAYSIGFEDISLLILFFSFHVTELESLKSSSGGLGYNGWDVYVKWTKEDYQDYLKWIPVERKR